MPGWPTSHPVRATPITKRRLIRHAVAATLLLGVVCLAGRVTAAESAEPPKANASNRAATNRPPLWSLQPLRRPTLPASEAKAARAARIGPDQNPIDAFVLSALEAKGLKPSPQADRRTLIRRLYFDLTGLPPAPDEIDLFLQDRDPHAYEKLVDRLLASPRYGERWARHWLDVVHFGETHGYDKDQPRPNAWPYRDYVIRSFNGDKPYARFLEEQIAGDVLFPDTRDGIEALGFIAAGPWDLIGHAEVPETKIDGKIARHLDRDDMVGNTIQTFNSLTVQCAQCHDHKFDPIPQADYYSLQAVFAAVDRTDRKYDTDPAIAARRKELTQQQTELVARQKELDEKIRLAAGPALAELDRKIAALPKSSNAFGYHSAIEKTPDTNKWVQVDLGRAVPLGSIVLHPCKDDFNGIGEGFGFPARFKVEVADDPNFQQGVLVVADQTAEDLPNPKLQARVIDVAGRTARYIRVTATKLALRQNDYIFALAELEALTANGNNVAQGAAVTALDSIEAPVRWQKKNLTDGWHPGGPAVAHADSAALKKEREELFARAATEADRQTRATLESDLKLVKDALAALPPLSSVYIATIHTGSGSFSGTGAKGGQPRPIHVLARGNIQKPTTEVGPGTLSCISELPARFELPPNHGESDRRAALAHWLSSPHNPLTWRSIVNRIWQYHFGRGLVETPNDFGRMGAPPSHPELLDWLAVEFRDGKQSFKTLHRLIVTSQTYRQESNARNAAAVKVDSDNRLLWRQNRRKLEAEAVRDSILAVSGQLDLTMAGPGFRDFVIDKPEHSPHYEYQLHDPEDPKSHRRSIYRFVVRSQQQPFMTVLDCADPSMQVGRRNESVSPLQALTLLNNSLMLAMSKHFAAEVEKWPGSIDDKISRAHETAVGRRPSAGELAVLVQFAQEHGLVNVCRVLFNLNEFAFVD